MKKEEIKRNMQGAVDAILFMPGLGSRFGSNNGEALRSFFVPLIVFPIVFSALYLCTPLGNGSVAEQTVSKLVALHYAGTISLFLAIVYFIAARIGRKDHFMQFVTAYNWITFPLALMLLIPLIGVMGGIYTAEELKPFLTFITCYGYAVTAYIAKRLLCLPMELGLFIAFLSLAVNNGTTNMLTWIVNVI